MRGSQRAPCTFFLNSVPGEGAQGAQGAQGADSAAQEGGEEGPFSWMDYVLRIAEPIDAVIISTYRVDALKVEENFGSIFSALNSTFSVVVFHGDSKCTEALRSRPPQQFATPTAATAAAAAMQEIPVTHFISYWEVDPVWRPLSSGGRSTLGVHHPKYVLVFTTASLHVIVSTANFTHAQAVDGSWVQAFPRSALPVEPCDFGRVLEDFVTQQFRQIVPCGLTPPELPSWLIKHGRCPDLACSFDFGTASVVLISTVPGRFPFAPLDNVSRAWLYNNCGLDPESAASAPCAQCQREAADISPPGEHLYGSLRVKQALEDMDPAIIRRLGSESRLLVQPTSVGAGVNNAFIGDFLENLMPEVQWQDDSDVLRADRWHLLWPTHDLVDSMASTRSYPPVGLPSTVGLLFMHPKTFALMEPDIHTQFSEYTPNPVRPYDALIDRCTPHFKSYTRLLPRSRDGRLPSPCSCAEVAWMLMTSACLSKGAQGSSVPFSICGACRHVKQGYREYRNFELGVLFKSSRHQLYKARSASCAVHCDPANAPSSGGSHAEVFLPLPFCVEGLRQYCDDTANLQFQPYFTESDEAAKYGAMPEDVLARTLSERSQLAVGSSVKKRSSFESGSQALLEGAGCGEGPCASAKRKNSGGAQGSSSIAVSHVLVKERILRSASLDPFIYCHVRASSQPSTQGNRVGDENELCNSQEDSVNISSFMC